MQSSDKGKTIPCKNILKNKLHHASRNFLCLPSTPSNNTLGRHHTSWLGRREGDKEDEEDNNLSGRRTTCHSPGRALEVTPPHQGCLLRHLWGPSTSPNTGERRDLKQRKKRERFADDAFASHPKLRRLPD